MTDKPETSPLNTNITKTVLEAFDETWKKLGLPNRTAALHEAMRDFIEKHREV